MSKKKSKSNKSSGEPNVMLDDQLIQGEAKAKPQNDDRNKVSLKEYSKTAPFAFEARNYKLLLIGLGINFLGFILMIGGATEDPGQFDASELFSNVRITIAPLLIVIGYVVILYAIMKKYKSEAKTPE